MAQRTCTGTTKNGRACRAAPLKDQDVCLAHADEKTRDSTGFGGHQPNAGRPRVPRLTEVLEARVEAAANEIVDVLFDALTATRGVTVRVGRGQDTIVETADHQTRVAAARELYDRAVGKAKQSTEITGADGGPLVHGFDLTGLSDEQLAVLRSIHAHRS